MGLRIRDIPGNGKCIICGKKFKRGELLVLCRHERDGEVIGEVPIHPECAKKAERYIVDAARQWQKLKTKAK